MCASFSVAQSDSELSAESSPGWAVIRHEPGLPNRFGSRTRGEKAVHHVGSRQLVSYNRPKGTS
jgi:hypothetical protein